MVPMLENLPHQDSSISAKSAMTAKPEVHSRQVQNKSLLFGMKPNHRSRLQSVENQELANPKANGFAKTKDRLSDFISHWN